jgi:hypothetical protein
VALIEQIELIGRSEHINKRLSASILLPGGRPPSSDKGQRLVEGRADVTVPIGPDPSVHHDPDDGDDRRPGQFRSHVVVMIQLEAICDGTRKQLDPHGETVGV